MPIMPRKQRTKKGFLGLPRRRRSKAAEKSGVIKLLVVDDELDICCFVRTFFTERKFSVLVTNSGEKAVEIVRTESPDIVLLDVTMPDKDGITVLKEIMEITPDAKVIMVTAVDDTDRAREAKQLGAVEYITKPLLLEQLERTVFTIAEQIRQK